MTAINFAANDWNSLGSSLGGPVQYLFCDVACFLVLLQSLVSFCFFRGPDFDTQLFGERGITVEKLLGELYEKVGFCCDYSSLSTI